ncbi:TPA: PTS transporter subunit EIIC [Salmonella enterica]|nr:PTS transporter subunit EIIC [Salmonella enterica]
MKKEAIHFFQLLSRAFITPIALLSFASLLLGIASLFLWHERLRELLPLLNSSYFQYIANLLNTVGSVIMDNLPLLFAVSLSFTLAKSDKEYAALGAICGYLALLMGMNALVTLHPHVKNMFPESAFTTTLGIETVNTGVVGGIITGLLSAIIHNRVYQIRFPVALAFFGGVRFVPLANVMFFVVFGQCFPFLWMFMSSAINHAALAVSHAGVFAPFIYGFGERLLLPTGLHQIWNTVIRDTMVSGIAVFPDGHSVEGARAIFAEYLKTNVLPVNMTLPDIVKFLRGGQIPITMFTLPAMALAMYQTAKPEQREKIKPLLLTGAFTSIIAGVTEPLEFTFLFVSPVWYFIYSLFNGLSWMLCYMSHSQLGGTEANIIGLVLYGFLRPESKFWINIGIGIVMAGCGYSLFRFWIVYFDLKTPGRGGDYEKTIDILGINQTDENITKDPLKLKASAIIKGLGGTDNIINVDCCYSRLRVSVNDASLIDEQIIQATGSLGFVPIDEKNVQIVYGTTVDTIRNAVKKLLV